MKLLISALLCLFPILLFGQITFEEITPPDDFNIYNIKQSPTGEYFTQAFNDHNSIYTSMDGESWSKTLLPGQHRLNDMQFYSDGTPILKESENSMIRRDGSWSIITNGSSTAWFNLPSIFLKNDTLFAYLEDDFMFSADKGLTFTTLFTASPTLVDHRHNLWKFENHFVLHHTAGASNHLTVFDQMGQVVLSESINVSIPSFVYNDCEEIIFYRNGYYVLKADLTSEQGDLTSEILPLNVNSEITSLGGNYYCKSNDKIYKSSGCGFNWEELAIDEEIMNFEFMSVNHQEDLFLFNEKSDSFQKKTNGSNIFEEYSLEINQPWLDAVDESQQEKQLISTSNNLFSKNLAESEWSELTNLDVNNHQLTFTPNGNFYTFQDNQILYSTDNGNTFTPIDMPEADPWVTWQMNILDDGIIYLNSIVFETDQYTIDNGINWYPVEIPFNTIYGEEYNLVNNFIYIVSLDSSPFAARINITTNEIIVEAFDDLTGFIDSEHSRFAVTDDGICHILVDWANGPDYEYYRFEFGGELEFIGPILNGQTLQSMHASNNEIFIFDFESIYQLDDNGTVDTIDINGLPEAPNWNPREYFITKNEFVYAIFDNSRIFRSISPLSNGNFISGLITSDLNHDCIPDSEDVGLQHWKVTVQNEAYSRVKTTNGEGFYNFDVPIGNYTVITQPVSSNWELCNELTNVSVTGNETQLLQNFRAKPINECARLTIDFSTPLIRRCFDNYYAIRITNTGPIASAGTTLHLQLDQFFDFLDATIPFTQLQDDQLEFDLGILEVNDVVTFKIYYNLSCEADLGAEHCLTGTLFDDNNCSNTLSHAAYTECQENIGAYDPNDKRAFNEAGKETAQIDTSEFIYYHIRFQNTGTDTAFNVKVIDYISDKLDLQTFNMLSASHEYRYEISDNSKLVVDFENIQLPDSTTNETDSHGFFKFKIKPLAEFGYGTEITNEAGIYFDFNEPVITNTAVVDVAMPVGINETTPLINFDIYPNPANAMLFLDISEPDSKKLDGYEIVNLLGQAVGNGKVMTRNEIKITHLQQGVYSILLKESGITIGAKKFIKL